MDECLFLQVVHMSAFVYLKEGSMAAVYNRLIESVNKMDQDHQAKRLWLWEL